MKKIIILFLGLFLFSCETSKKPKNLLKKDKMAEIIADLSIYEQSFSVNPHYNPQHIGLFVFKKHNIQQKDFDDSFAYYIENPSLLNNIYDQAKEIILNKDPKMRYYLEEKNKKLTRRD